MAKNNTFTLPIRQIFGVPFFVGTKQSLLAFFTRLISNSPEKRRLQVVFTPNPEQMTLALHDAEFKQLLTSSDINLPDGAGIVWALRRQGVKVNRIAGRGLFHELLLLSREEKWRIFLLGGRPGSARLVAKQFQLDSSVFDCDEGASDIKHEAREEKQRVLGKIKSFKPDILFVAYGAPWQEKWVMENRGELEAAGVKLAMVVGGAFDYEAGLVPKVPKLIESANLEWLWRLVTEPWRWQRQLKGLEFFWRVLTSK